MHQQQLQFAAANVDSEILSVYHNLPKPSQNYILLYNLHITISTQDGGVLCKEDLKPELYIV